jgi:hypothetical protein
VYRYTFVMANPTDVDGRIEFNLGGILVDVYLHNVTLRMLSASDLDRDGGVDLDDLKLLTLDWLKTGTSLVSDLNRDGRVDFLDSGLLGAEWSTGNLP